MKRIFYFTICLATLWACDNNKQQKRAFARMSQFEDKNIVVTDYAKQGIFYREFESNGKLEAVNRAILKFEVDEEITEVKIKEGQRVERGQVLAVLDDTKLRHSYNKALRNLDKSRLNLEDVLIGMGYQLKDSASISPDMMKIALIRSGYTDAESEKEMAQLQLQKTKIRAPFSGIVASLEAKAFNRTNQYKEFCTLINDDAFELEFPILENEASQLRKGMPLVIIPYAFDKDTLSGVLSSINPMVNETGMVTAKALIQNKTGKLIEGMNAKIIVRDPVPNQLVIPKSAVTLRQERNVVFTCKNDTAYWNYVSVKEENSTYCTIKCKDIKAGDEVITDGNFNLSHLATVVKMNN